MKSSEIKTFLEEFMLRLKADSCTWCGKKLEGIAYMIRDSNGNPNMFHAECRDIYLNKKDNI